MCVGAHLLKKIKDSETLMAKTILRLAEQSDVPRMLSIYAPYVQETVISFELEVPSVKDFADRLAAHEGDMPWIVCVQDGLVQGYAYISAFSPRPAYGWTCETSVYVDKYARGNGIGRKLYTALEGIARELGYPTLYARITTPNPESERFHQRLGYKKEAMLHNVGCKFGRFLDVAYYKKELLQYTENMQHPVKICNLEEKRLVEICGNAAL